MQSNSTSSRTVTGIEINGGGGNKVDVKVNISKDTNVVESVVTQSDGNEVVVTVNKNIHFQMIEICE